LENLQLKYIGMGKSKMTVAGQQAIGSIA